MLPEEFKNLEVQIPEDPGVYRYYDSKDELIYVGKAKNLRKRVSSYFQKKLHESRRIMLLIKKINKIEYTIVNSEIDALLLENNLIKNHQPRFNIRLKDDKTYPYIVIRNEPFPRVHPSRRVIRDGSTYIGPYASVRMMHTILDLVRKIIPLRSCKLNLAPQHIQALKYRVCLEFQIGNCKGPCENLQTLADYNEGIVQVKEILKGNISGVVSHYKKKMQAHAAAYQFEQAHSIKQKIEFLENYQSKSTIVNPLISSVDVFGIALEERTAIVNYMQIEHGAVVNMYDLEIDLTLEETLEELLLIGIVELREKFKSTSRELVVPTPIDFQIAPDLTITVPKIGDKKKLLDLSLKNARHHLQEKLKLKDITRFEDKSKAVMQRMQKDLGLSKPPVYIECFDNSNLHGTYPVSACVVFKNGKPSKKDYRHFNIKTVEGPNDFASMTEVLTRRYSRLVAEKQPLPDLVIIDGGKGQLSASVEALENLQLMHKIPIISIAKNLEELFFPNDPVPLYLDKNSITLKIIQQLRDEAHRFGITHHRQKRSKGTIKTGLTDIEGVGKATAEKLLNHFRSVQGLKNASIEEIGAIIGLKKAAALKEKLG